MLLNSQLNRITSDTIDVDFLVEPSDDPLEYLSTLAKIPSFGWLAYLKDNATNINLDKQYNPHMHLNVITYSFRLPEELLTYYYLTYR